MLLYCRDSSSFALPSLDLDGDCKPEVYGSYQTQMGAGKSVTNSTDRLDRLEAIIESNSRAIQAMLDAQASDVTTC